MTIEEASKRYQIPLKILREYESWGLYDGVQAGVRAAHLTKETSFASLQPASTVAHPCESKVVGSRQYDDRDIERLGLIMTLYDLGFSKKEIEQYMRLSLSEQDRSKECLRILEKHRSSTLEEIHLKESQLSRIDYLRHEMRMKVERPSFG